MIPIPEDLLELLRYLSLNKIKAILVGGFVRDALLQKVSSDIDIELYGVTSLETLETLLKPFGKVGVYGKSFGVLKLSYAGYHIDFAPPRTESKSGFGHKGFEVHWQNDLDYTEASKRRDFTINAIGYDPLSRTLLDPHKGVDDLQNKRLRYVDKESFADDPLRALRALQFAARYDLVCDKKLLALCTSMLQHGALVELPKERIFEEIKKLLLSPKPSIGLKLLDQMGGRELFGTYPDDTAWNRALDRCDHLLNTLENLPLRLAALLLETSSPHETLEKITFHRTLSITVLKIIAYTKTYAIFDFPPKPILQGRDLMAFGINPSPDYKTILEEGYHAQQKGSFTTHPDAIKWLRNHLVTRR